MSIAVMHRLRHSDEIGDCDLPSADQWSSCDVGDAA